MRLSQIQLMKLLSYDEKSGIFIRKTNGHGPRSRINDICGYDSGGGYLRTTIFGKEYKLHRLVWLYMYGHWPDGFIDHIDGNPSNNKLENLRVATRQINSQNQRKAQKSSTTGFLGVIKKTGGSTYYARLNVNGKRYTKHGFISAADAFVAYLELKRKYHEGCSI